MEDKEREIMRKRKTEGERNKRRGREFVQRCGFIFIREALQKKKANPQRSATHPNLKVQYKYSLKSNSQNEKSE